MDIEQSKIMFLRAHNCESNLADVMWCWLGGEQTASCSVCIISTQSLPANS